jgi:hypothetical protein
MYLLDPNYGAVGAGSHRPLRFNPQQRAAAQAAWKLLSKDEQQRRMAEVAAKIKVAHAEYVKNHPEDSPSNRTQLRGTVSVPLNGATLQFPVDGRQTDVPVGFRDINGKRILRTPAVIRTTANKGTSAVISPKTIPLPSNQMNISGWHKLDTVMKRNVATGEHLAFLRTSQVATSSQVAQPNICPVWGCGGCRFCGTGDDDSDGDSVPDGVEYSVANSFTPTYHVSDHEQSGTGFATMQDQPPENVQTSYGPTPPISYYRVTSSNYIGTGTDQYGNTVYHRYLRIDYLTLWNEDDGLAHGLTCDLAVGGSLGYAEGLLSGVIGFDVAAISAGLGGHYLDNEHSAVLVAVQVNGPNDMTFPSDYTLYNAVEYFTAAHEHTGVDASEYFAPNTAIPHDTHIDLYLSQSKHSTYFYNPDRKPIVVSGSELDFIEGVLIPYLGIDFWWDYYDWCPVDPNYYYIVLPDGEIVFGIDNGDGSCYLPDYYYDLPWVAAVEVLADETFTDCLGEHFTDLGPMFAQQTINVGEPNNPSYGNHFIQDTTPDYAGSKLTESIFPYQQL